MLTHANGTERQHRLSRIAQIPQMRERIDRAAGEQMRRLGVPINVGDDTRVRPQRMYERRIARTPGYHLDQLTGGNGAILLALLADCPFGGGHFVLGVAVEFPQTVLVVELVETLQGQMTPANSGNFG